MFFLLQRNLSYEHAFFQHTTYSCSNFLVTEWVRRKWIFSETAQKYGTINFIFQLAVFELMDYNFNLLLEYADRIWNVECSSQCLAMINFLLSSFLPAVRVSRTSVHRIRSIYRNMYLEPSSIEMHSWHVSHIRDFWMMLMILNFGISRFDWLQGKGMYWSRSSYFAIS